MGKTSVARELGRRLEASGWIALFVDVESANSEEEVIADIARAVHPIRPLRDRAFNAVRNWFAGNVDEIGALECRVKFTGGGEFALRELATSRREPLGQGFKFRQASAPRHR